MFIGGKWGSPFLASRHLTKDFGVKPHEFPDCLPFVLELLEVCHLNSVIRFIVSFAIPYCRQSQLLRVSHQHTTAFGNRNAAMKSFYYILLASLATLLSAAPVEEVSERATTPTVYLAGDSTMAVGGGGTGTQGTRPPCVFINTLLTASQAGASTFPTP